MVDLAGSVPVGLMTAMVDGRAETVSGLLVTGNYFSMLGVAARAGRTIEPAMTRSRTTVVMLSERYWRSRFAADPQVLGRVITIANVPLTVVGITPASFNGTQRPLAEPRDVILPIALDPRVRGEDRLHSATNWWVQIMGRLKPGVTVEQVHGNLAGGFRDQAKAGMEHISPVLTESERNTAEHRSHFDVPALIAESGRQGVYDANTNDVRALEIIAIVAALVLLLVCATSPICSCRAPRSASASCPCACRWVRRARGCPAAADREACCSPVSVARSASWRHKPDTSCFRHRSARPASSMCARWR
jgi:hypothetical protein